MQLCEKTYNMSRILAIDYGTKKCGIAVSDPLRIIAGGLTTVSRAELNDFLGKYLKEEVVGIIVLGLPYHLDGNPAQLHSEILAFAKKLKSLFPSVKIAFQDETLTSEEAKKIILQSGVKKKKRQDKTLVDKVSAVLILQQFMERK